MRKLYIFGLIALAVVINDLALADEMTFTTYYPAPAGVYNNMVVMNSLGVGTTSPNARLEVNDSIAYTPRAGDPTEWSAGTAGELAYSGQKGGFYFYSGSAWAAVGGGKFSPPNFDTGWLNWGHSRDSRLKWDSSVYGYRIDFSDFTHTLGSNADNYVVDLEFFYSHPTWHGSTLGVTQFGGDAYLDSCWRNLTNASIGIEKMDVSSNPDKVRVRIWDYSQ